MQSGSQQEDKEDKVDKEQFRLSKLQRAVLWMAGRCENCSINEHLSKEDITFLEQKVITREPPHNRIKVKLEEERETARQFFKDASNRLADKKPNSEGHGFNFEDLFDREPHLFFSYLILLHASAKNKEVTQIYHSLSPESRKVIYKLCKSGRSGSYDKLLLSPVYNNFLEGLLKLINYDRIEDLLEIIKNTESDGSVECSTDVDNRCLSFYIDLELDDIDTREKQKFLRAKKAILRLNNPDTKNDCLKKMWHLLNSFRKHKHSPGDSTFKDHFNDKKKEYEKLATLMFNNAVSPRTLKIAGYLMLVAGIALSALCSLSAASLLGASAAPGLGIGAAGAFSLAGVFFNAAKNAVNYEDHMKDIYDSRGLLPIISVANNQSEV